MTLNNAGQMIAIGTYNRQLGHNILLSPFSRCVAQATGVSDASTGPARVVLAFARGLNQCG